MTQYSLTEFLESLDNIKGLHPAGDVLSQIIWDPGAAPVVRLFEKDVLEDTGIESLVLVGTNVPSEIQSRAGRLMHGSPVFVYRTAYLFAQELQQTGQPLHWWQSDSLGPWASTYTTIIHWGVTALETIGVLHRTDMGHFLNPEHMSVEYLETPVKYLPSMNARTRRQS